MPKLGLYPPVQPVGFLVTSSHRSSCSDGSLNIQVASNVVKSYYIL